MFTYSSKFDKPGAGTTYIIAGQGQLAAGKADGVFPRSFFETVCSLGIDGLTSETWAVAVQMQGSSEWKTLATGLTNASLYLIPGDLVYQAIKVTISATTACSIRVSARPQSARNYG